MATLASAAGSMLLLVIRLGLGGLFGLAAVIKLGNPQAFADAIHAFKLLPPHLNVFAALAFPWVELFVAVALIVGVWTRAAAAVAALLTIGFIIAIASVMVRADVVVAECGCFGDFVVLCTGSPGWCHIGQDVVLIGLSTLLVLRGGGFLAVDRYLLSRAQKRARIGWISVPPTSEPPSDPPTGRPMGLGPMESHRHGA